MVIQPDMNLPAGESFVRQVLLGKRYLRERLGVEPRIAYCVDSSVTPVRCRKFCASAASMPTCSCAPAAREGICPPMSSGGGAGRQPYPYLSHRRRVYDRALSTRKRRILDAVAAKPAALDATMCFFGVGNHGGGPTRAQIENVHAVATAHPELEICFSSPAAYFAAIAGQTGALPVVTGELQYHAAGCSGERPDRRGHRQAECRLLVAERMAVLAAQWMGAKYPQRAAGRTVAHALFQPVP